MAKFLRIILFLFPLFLLGMFFIVWQVWAQQAVVSATIKLNVCGDNIAEGQEACDNTDFNGLSCNNYGFNRGSLKCNLDCTIDTDNCYTENLPPGGGGGGGGGGVVVSPPSTSVFFSGRAYPLSSVTILKDGQIAVTTIAGPDAKFDVKLSGLSTGNYNFSVYSEDDDGNRSSLFTFSVFVTTGSSTEISGIFLAPTISTDKSEVKYGEDIAIFGQSVPDSTVTVNINSDQEFFRYVQTDKNGAYLHYFDTTLLEKGDHSARSKVRLAEEVSDYGQSVAFLVGESNIDRIKDDSSCSSRKADLNCDAKINIVDFSIAAYWYKRSNPDLKVDLNKDGKVDLIDFSIMAFYWTG